jgi:hypothetical protein
MSKDSGQGYLNARTRVKNKTRRLEARIKRMKPEAQELVKKHCPIGRAKEGFKRAQFPRRKPLSEKELNERATKPVRLPK